MNEELNEFLWKAILWVAKHGSLISKSNSPDSQTLVMDYVAAPFKLKFEMKVLKSKPGFFVFEVQDNNVCVYYAHGLAAPKIYDSIVSKNEISLWRNILIDLKDIKI